MALLSKHSGQSFDFTPAPEGDFQAVIVDVVDLGYLEKSFQGQSQGLKPHVQIVYQLGGLDESGDPVLRDDGKPYFVFGRRQVLSMNERAGFYKEVCGIVGKKKVDDAVAAGTLDTEDLLGLNVNLTIAHHNGSNGQTYANIESLKPWNTRFGEPIAPLDYQRRHLRDNYIEPEYSSFGPPPPADSTPPTSIPPTSIPIVPVASSTPSTSISIPVAKPVASPDPRADNRRQPTPREYARSLVNPRQADPPRLQCPPVAAADDEEDVFA